MRPLRPAHLKVQGNIMPKPDKPPGKPIKPPPPEPLPPPPYPGIEAKPDTLAGILSSSVVAAGDTVWLTQGTYTGAWECLLEGTESAPIIIRGIPGHRVVFDGYWTVRGAYTWFWGFEVTRTVRDATNRRSAIECLTSHHKFVNLFIHDNDQGIGTFNDSTDTEVYGCILYRNGWIDTDRNHGHGLYIQNNIGEKWVRDNIFTEGLAYGIHAYGQQGNLKHLRFQGNVSYNNQANNFFIGGYLPAEDILVHENTLYQSSMTTLCAFGYNVAGNIGLDCQGNKFLNGKAQLRNWHDSILYKNNLHVTGGDIITYNPESGIDYPAADWNENTYLCNKVKPFATDGAGWFSFEEWKTLTRYDANSAFTTIYPPDLTLVQVRPNAYEEGRAHIVAYVRGGGVSSISVDLHGVLLDGESYALYKVPDLTTPVATGVYNNGSLVSVPLLGAEFATFLLKPAI